MDSSTEALPDDEHTVRWYGITHALEWESTVQARAQGAWMACLVVVKDRKALEADREAARCQMEIWNEIIGWANKYETELNEMKAAESKTEEKEELVGPRAEDQWYEK